MTLKCIKYINILNKTKCILMCYMETSSLNKIIIIFFIRIAFFVCIYNNYFYCIEQLNKIFVHFEKNYFKNLIHILILMIHKMHIFFSISDLEVMYVYDATYD